MSPPPAPTCVSRKRYSGGSAGSSFPGGRHSWRKVAKCARTYFLFLGVVVLVLVLGLGWVGGQSACSWGHALHHIHLIHHPQACSKKKALTSCPSGSATRTTGGGAFWPAAGPPSTTTSAMAAVGWWLVGRCVGV